MRAREIKKELEALAKSFRNISHRTTTAGIEVCAVHYDLSDKKLHPEATQNSGRYLVRFDEKTQLPSSEVVDNGIRYDVCLRSAIWHRVDEVLEYIRKTADSQV